MKVYFERYGCTLNKGETDVIEEVAINRGYNVVNKPECADRIVLSTCAVIETTERHMLKRVKELSSLNKELFVTGCLARYRSEEIEKYENAHAIKEIDVEKLLRESSSTKNATKEFHIANLPISKGCTGNCSYCVTRIIKGKLKSYDIDLLTEKARDFIEKGAKEIRIASQDNGCYGFDRGRGTLPELINRISSIRGDFRIRVGMMTPNNFAKIEPDLLNSYENEKVYKFLHLPIQSGDDKILKAMGRKYTVSEYMEMIERFREEFDDLMLSTDVIVGFPGESDANFMKTYELIEKIKPNIVNITRFSPRKGTDAAEMSNKIIGRTCKHRSRMLTQLAREIGSEMNKKWVGKEMEIMIVESGKNGSVVGRSNSYRPVVIKDRLPLGSFVKTKIVDATSTYLIGAESGKGSNGEGSNGEGSNGEGSNGGGVKIK